MEVSDQEDQDEEIDWEELESQLYCQIYHAAATEEELDPEISKSTMSVNVNTEIIGNRRKFRYFETPKSVPNQSSTSLPSFIPLGNLNQKPDNYNISTIQKNISSLQSDTRNTISRGPTHVHNNITVNQYIPPLIIQSDSVSSSEPLSFFAPWHANVLKVIEKNKILDKKKRKKEKLLRRIDRRKNNLRLANEKKQNSVTIFVDSDLSDDECVVVENESAKNIVTKIRTGFPKKYDESTGSKKPEDDDEIIYIPPPPVEVINVDIDETEASSKEQSNIDVGSNLETLHADIAEKSSIDAEKSPVSTETQITTSNDFLDNVILQGSDSNNQHDFIKPTNPIDYCETESSCSTNNEQNSDFSNTVKTIVFDEVDFPKEDIFSDHNLEGFGSFITPKRTTRKSKRKLSSSKTNEAEPKNTEKDDSSSDGSSSESDYEETNNRSRDKNKNLPSLSPMMSPDAPKKVSKKKKTATDFFSNDIPKSKKKNLTKSQKKQKQKKVKELVDLELDNMKEMRKKKKKQQTEVDDNLNMSSISNDKKQKKRKSLNLDDSTQMESTTTSTEKPKKKKKKISTSIDHDDPEKSGTTLSNSTIVTEENIVSNQNLAIHSPGLNTIEVISAEVDESTCESITTSTPQKETKLSQNPPLNSSELIIVDATPGKEVIQIIPSDSESEKDFQTLDDVGDDMELANCTGNPESLCNNDGTVSTEGVTKTCSLPTRKHTMGDSNFDIYSIQRNQSDDPEKWQISYRDSSYYFSMDRAKGPRCNRCRHYGHIAIRCSEKPNPPNCALCGGENHQEPRCPNKRCTQCGNEGNFSTSYCWKCFKFRHTQCKLCNMSGHLERNCPDLWRRYHLTTGEGPIVTAQESSLARNQQWCSGCAGQGHLEHECNYYNREYPPTTPFIVRYEDNLSQQNSRIPRGMVPNPVLPHASDVMSPFEQNLQTSSLLGHPSLVPIAQLLFNHVQHVQVPNPFAIPSLFAQVQLPFEVLQNHLPNSSLQKNTGQETIVDTNSQDTVAEMGPRFTLDVLNKNVAAVSRNFNFRNSHNVDGTEMDLTDILRSKHLIMTAQAKTVHEFLSKEMDELNNNVSNCDFKLLRKKLFKYDKMLINSTQTKEIREKRFWFRILNMVLFGIRGLRSGKSNLNILKTFVEQSVESLNTLKRKSLFSAYSYIFGIDKRNLNYYREMQLMIQSQGEGKLRKFTYCT